MFFLRIAEAYVASQEASETSNSMSTDESTRLDANSPDSLDGNTALCSVSRDRQSTSWRSSNSLVELGESRRACPRHCVNSSVSAKNGLQKHSSEYSHSASHILSPLSVASSLVTTTTTTVDPLHRTGGLLYNLLVSNDTPASTNGSLAPNKPNLTQAFLTTTLDNCQLMPNQVAASLRKPLSRYPSQSLFGVHSGFSGKKEVQPICPVFSVAERHPCPVVMKRSKISNNKDVEYGNFSECLMPTYRKHSFSMVQSTTEHLIEPRRSSFGGCVAPRGERLASILQSMDTPTIPSLQFKPLQTLKRTVSSSPLIKSSATSNGGTPPNWLIQTSSASCSTPSILSALISSPCSDLSPEVLSISTDSGLDEPLDLTGNSLFSRIPGILSRDFAVLMRKAKPTLHLSPASPSVQLAKKIARPVQARITEWLRQACEFVVSWVNSPLFQLCHQPICLPAGQVWRPIFSRTWHRLLALSMAEFSIDLVFVDSSRHPTDAGKNNRSTSTTELLSILVGQEAQTDCLIETAIVLPDREFTDQLLNCIADVQAESITQEEFILLRHAILLTAEQPLILPAVGMSLIQRGRADELASESPSPVSHLNTKSVHKPDLGRLHNGLMVLSKLCREKMAHLFCCHLRAEACITSVSPANLKRVTFGLEPCNTEPPEALSSASTRAVVSIPTQDPGLDGISSPRSSAQLIPLYTAGGSTMATSK